MENELSFIPGSRIALGFSFKRHFKARRFLSLKEIFLICFAISRRNFLHFMWKAFTCSSPNFNFLLSFGRIWYLSTALYISSSGNCVYLSVKSKHFLSSRRKQVIFISLVLTVIFESCNVETEINIDISFVSFCNLQQLLRCFVEAL